MLSGKLAFLIDGMADGMIASQSASRLWGMKYSLPECQKAC